MTEEKKGRSKKEKQKSERQHFLEQYREMLDILGFDYAITSPYVVYKVNRTLTYKKGYLSTLAWNHVKGDKKDSVYASHFGLRYRLNDRLKSGSMGLREWYNTNVLAIDIDTHDERLNRFHFRDRNDLKEARRQARIKRETIIKELNNLFNDLPLFEEHSRLFRGSHVYYLFNQNINAEFKDRIQNYILEKTGYQIEIRSRTKTLRTPFARDYCRKFNQDHLDHFWNSYIICINNPIKYHEVLERLNPKEELQTIPVLPVIKEKQIIHVREKGHHIPFDKYCSTNYYIEAGNRVGGRKILFSMGFAAIHHKVSKEDFVNSVLMNPGSSKDLAKWSRDKSQKVLEKIYDFCEFRYNKSKYPVRTEKEKEEFEPTFQSNQDLLSRHERSIAKRISRRIHYQNPMKYRKVSETQKEVLEIMVKEIFSQFLYDYQNQKQIVIPVSHRIKKLLTISTFFSQTWLNRFQEFYKIENIDLSRLLYICLKYLCDNSIIYLSLRSVSTPLISYCNQYRLNIFSIFNRLFYQLLLKQPSVYSYDRKFLVERLKGIREFETIKEAWTEFIRWFDFPRKGIGQILIEEA